MSFFENALSIRIAKIASLIFLSYDTSEDKRKFFATCCVIVDAPINLLAVPIFFILVIKALNVANKSIPK